jgi:MSHA biogenesis protein MshM
MYLEFFGMRELPFTLTPNTDFFLDLDGHHQALDVIQLAMESGEGFIMITGEVGTGKTLLCRRLLNIIDDDKFMTAYVPNPFLTPTACYWLWPKNWAWMLPMKKAVIMSWVKSTKN